MKQFYFPTICMMGLILLLSCQSKQTSQALIPETETPPAPAKTLSEAIASYKFIPLATDDTTLVGNITKILKYKDNYYIASNNKEILVFHTDGSFSHRINRQGRGPQEYVELNDFDIAEDQIVILSFRKIVVYTLDGTFVNSMDFDFNGLNIQVVGGNYLLRSNIESFLRTIDRHSGACGPLQIDMQENLRLTRNNCFLPLGKEILIQQGNSNTFCRYSDDTPTEVFNVSLLSDPDLMTSEKENQLTQSNTTPNLKMILDMAASQTQYYCGVGNPVTQEAVLYILDMHNHRIIHTLSLQTTDDLTYMGIGKTLQNISLGRASDAFLTFLRVSELREAILRHGDDGSEHSRWMKEHLLDRLHDDDNPVLFEFRFK
ncbi:6-bladed beta-propeller [uncultured Alistipes sp.]|uniref:6-bladed beta-propeller n=1 Tax=uncultured Alistipes sp. TaxID=538949 RepID=UPI00262756D4|nr:6-bladed beta-propeller [uncultured Alistipes sp.]